MRGCGGSSEERKVEKEGRMRGRPDLQNLHDSRERFRVVLEVPRDPVCDCLPIIAVEDNRHRPQGSAADTIHLSAGPWRELSAPYQVIQPIFETGAASVEHEGLQLPCPPRDRGHVGRKSPLPSPGKGHSITSVPMATIRWSIGDRGPEVYLGLGG